LEFRTCPDHPPIAPTFNGDCIYFSALVFR
jgi:hypothetical protein